MFKHCPGHVLFPPFALVWLNGQAANNDNIVSHHRDTKEELAYLLKSSLIFFDLEDIGESNFHPHHHPKQKETKHLRPDLNYVVGFSF